MSRIKEIAGLAWPGVATFLAAVVLSGMVSYQLGERRALRADLDSLMVRFESGRGRVSPNVVTDFNADMDTPAVDSTAYLDAMSSVIGAVEIGRGVYVAPFASIRGDEGQPIHIGDFSNVQDGAVVHGLETADHGVALIHRTYAVAGREYAVFIGQRVSLAHQALVHGPARIDDDVFVGMQALVFRAHVGEGAVVEPGARVIGVTVPPGRIVPAGTTLTRQVQADSLAPITAAYQFHGINDAVVHANEGLGRGYAAARRALREALWEELDPGAAAEVSGAPRSEEPGRESEGHQHGPGG